MSGVAVTIRVEGFADIDRVLSQWETADTALLKEGIAGKVEDQTRTRIGDEKTAPDGTAWPELSDDYAAWKSTRSGGGLLQLDGNLLDSIQAELAGDEIEVGSNLVYAAPHQFGWEEGGIPQREYLGLSPDNTEELETLLDDWIQGVFDES